MNFDFWAFSAKKVENRGFLREFSKIEKNGVFQPISYFLVSSCVKTPKKGYQNSLSSITLQYRVENCIANITLLYTPKSAVLKIGDFTILDPKCAIFDEITFGEKISKCARNKKTHPKNHTIMAKKKTKKRFF